MNLSANFENCHSQLFWYSLKYIFVSKTNIIQHFDKNVKEHDLLIPLLKELIKICRLKIYEKSW